MKEYIQAIADSFNAASKLLWHDTLTNSEFIAVATELQQFKAIKEPKGLWNDWPQSPVSFPLYFRAGSSALDVANRFSLSMDTCIQVAKVATVGMPSDYRKLSDESIVKWKEATSQEIARVCEYGTPIVRFREVDLMRQKLSQELMGLSVDSAEDKQAAKAAKLWNEKPELSWADITEKVTKDRSLWRSFRQAVIRYASRVGIKLRKGTSGSKRQAKSKK